MFERFTSSARQVVVTAQAEARALGHDHIGSEHLLLSLANPDSGTAAQALSSLGITQQAVREQVEGMAGRGEPPPVKLPFTPQAKKVLERSLYEAIRLGDDHIRAEHLLLGVLREDRGPAVQVLARLGTGPDAVRQQVLGLLAAVPGASGPATAVAPARAGAPGRRGGLLARFFGSSPGPGG